jgi:hypothetical protein
VEFEELGDLHRVGAVAFHAEVQRLEALEEQERVERREAAANVAQELQAASS